MAQAFFGGVHPNDMKAATNEKAIEQLAAPAEVVIPMSMHIGAPCKPVVSVGDKVTVGQLIGEPGGFVSAPIHASVSGTVKAVEPRPFSMGGTMMSVVIENDKQNTVCPDIHPVEDPDNLTPEQLVEIVKNAGIVGQGGATFPTHVKISSGLGKVDYVLINAAECEPYITGDHRTMLERPEQVVKGATLLAKCFGVDKVYIGIEANKQNAADVLNQTIAELKAPVVVEVLHTRYPQGAEKQLCQAISGRQVPSGKLPADAGCCIFNLNTTCSIYKAVYTGMPVVSKIVTVSGSGVIEPKNIECPIGTPITDLFDACGGLKEDTYKLIMGGPMMGLAQYDLDVTVGKGTGAMLAFAGDEEKYVAEPQCIRCGKCVGVCPMRLEPVFMYKYLEKGDVDTWQNVLHGMDCIECGACAYTCPARLPLTHMFRMGKQKVNNARMAAKAKAEAEKKAAEEKKEA
ncbi:MAG: electron transport complex subunit RsxC [Clostridiales bacterium]|nr:electron transport complex subunit RsxC [Clostridiales bacterium]